MTTTNLELSPESILKIFKELESDELHKGQWISTAELYSHFSDAKPTEFIGLLAQMKQERKIVVTFDPFPKYKLPLPKKKK